MSLINVSSIIKAEKSQVFAVISNPITFEALVPQSMALKLKSTPIKARKGAEYEFAVTRFGVTQIMNLRVEKFEEGRQISFDQSLGFFRQFSIAFELDDFKPGETRISIFLNYDIPLGVFGKLYDDLHLRRYLEQTLENICFEIAKRFTA